MESVHKLSMNQNRSPLELIRRRKAALADARAKEEAERHRLDAEAAARAKEEEEIAIAERVYQRLAEESDFSLDPLEPVQSPGKMPWEANVEPVAASPETLSALRVNHGHAYKPPATGGSQRPEGLPTVPQMVTALLIEAERAGNRGLNSAEIMAGVDAKYWPGVSVNMIMPTIYRCIARNHWFKKQGKLFVRIPGGQPISRNSLDPVDRLKFDS